MGADISLRQYYAARAMSALLICVDQNEWEYKSKEGIADEVVEFSYLIADKMIKHEEKEREKPAFNMGKEVW
jgi:hypothetical protein